MVTVVVDVVVGKLVETFVMSVWNRPELGVIRAPIETRLKDRAFIQLTKQSFQAFFKEAEKDFPNMLTEGFIGQIKVQEALVAYVNKGEAVDIDQMLTIYEGTLQEGNLPPNARQALESYLESLRETLYADPTYGPILLARDTQTMLNALQRNEQKLDRGIEQVESQLASVHLKLDVLLENDEILHTLKRRQQLHDHIRGRLVRLIKPFVPEETRRAFLTTALGADYAGFAQLTWTLSDQAFTEQLVDILYEQEVYPGRNTLVAVVEYSLSQLSGRKLTNATRVLDTIIQLLEAPDRPDSRVANHIYLAFNPDQHILGEQLLTELRQHDFEVWDVSQAKPGENQRERRHQKLEYAETIIAMLSAESETEWIIHEAVKTAQLTDKQIIPIFVNGWEPTENSLFEALSNLNPIRISDETDFKSTLVTVVDVLNSPTVQRTPFKGLEAFQEADAAYYFGREEQVSHLATVFRNGSRFFAIIGGSGVGKSSLVRAGLIPALKSKSAPVWNRMILTPGVHPVRALAEQFHHLLEKEYTIAQIHQRLDTQSDAIQTLSTDALQQDKKAQKLLIFIDQFEEVFSAEVASSEAKQFIDLLTQSVKGGPQAVVLTMRGDFVDNLSTYPTLASLIQTNIEIVAQLETADLLDVIQKPAQQAGLVYEQGLPNRIVQDVISEAGALPLLQYALKQLYDKRKGRNLTIQAYHDIGGIQRALANHADSVYLELSQADRQIAKQLFLDLIQIHPQTGDITKRRRTWQQLSQDQTSAGLRRVVDVLTAPRNRLLIAQSETQSDNQTSTWIELSHEALLRHWGRFTEWITDATENLKFRELIEEEAERWQLGNQDKSYLLSGSRLARAQEWITQESEMRLVTPLHEKFVYVSTSESQKQIRRLRLFAIGAGVVAFIAIVATIIAFIQSNNEQIARQDAEDNQQIAIQERDRANQERTTADARRLALQSLLELDENQPDVALLLSAAALDIEDTREGRTALLTTLQRVPKLERFLYGHTGSVQAVAYSESYFATADETGQILLWDAEKQSVVGSPLTAHMDGVRALAFSADGALLASGGDDGMVYLWNPVTGAQVGEPIKIEDTLYSLAFHPSESWLALGTGNMGVQIWDVETMSLLAQMDEQSQIFSVAFSPDGSYLATGGSDSEIHIWNKDFMLDHTLAGHTNWVMTVAFDPTQPVLASGSADNTVRLWDIKTGEMLGQPLTEHNDWVHTLAYSSNGQWLISGSGDESIIIRDAATGRRASGQTLLVGHSANVNALAIQPDTSYFVSGGADGRLLLWNIASPPTLSTPFASHDGRIYSLNFANDGEQIVAGDSNRHVMVWDASSARVIGSNFTGAGEILDVAVHSNLRAVVTSEGRLYGIDTTNDTLLFEADDFDGAVRTVAISPDGSIVATGSDDQLIRFWNTASGEIIDVPLVGHTGEITDLAFSPNGAWLVSGSMDTTLRLWDMSDLSQVDILPQIHTDAIMTIGFSPDTNLFVSGSRDGTAIMWDIAQQTQVGLILTGHDNWILDAEFSPDGQIIATASRDTSIRLWDVQTQQVIGLPLQGSDWIWSLDFSPDGKLLASGDDAGQIWLWDVDVNSWINQVCELANRKFYQQELIQYSVDNSCIDTDKS